MLSINWKLHIKLHTTDNSARKRLHLLILDSQWLWLDNFLNSSMICHIMYQDSTTVNYDVFIAESCFILPWHYLYIFTVFGLCITDFWVQAFYVFELIILLTCILISLGTLKWFGISISAGFFLVAFLGEMKTALSEFC